MVDVVKFTILNAFQKRSRQIMQTLTRILPVCYYELFVNSSPLIITWDRRQLKMLFTIDECGSKIVKSRVFDCHLSPDWRQMAIKNTVSSDFLSTFLHSINVFDCRLSSVITIMLFENRKSKVFEISKHFP